MKRVHTTKKKANRPFKGVGVVPGYNSWNSKGVRGQGPVNKNEVYRGKIARPAYKRATS